MTTHQTFKNGLAFSLVALLIAGCGGGGDDAPMASAPPDVTVAVPTEATTSATAAITYVASLSAEPESKTDALEPVDVPEQLAQDDTAEPQ